MMLYGIGTFTSLEGTRHGESSASYQKIPPRFRDTLDEVAPQAAPVQLNSSQYIVQKGDTLAEIVRKQLAAQGKPADSVAVFDAVREVAKNNHLGNANRLHIGQTLDLGGLAAPSGAPAAAQPLPSATSLPQTEVQVLPPLPQPKASAKGLVETKPLPDPVKSTRDAAKSQAANEPSSKGGGGRFQPIGPLASFSSQRSVMISPGPQGGPSHPIGRDLLTELLPGVHYPADRAAGRPDLGKLIDRLLAPPKANAKGSAASAEVVPSAAAPATLPADTADAPWEKTVDAPVRITSAFGVRKDPFTHHADFHEGLDLAAAAGSDIHPIADGKVTFSGWKNGYGRVVIVDHGDGIESVYGHTSKTLVVPGQQVDAKSVLGRVGSSGRATGPHLHLEVRQNGAPIDPVAYLSGAAAQRIPATILAQNEE